MQICQLVEEFGRSLQSLSNCLKQDTPPSTESLSTSKSTTETAIQPPKAILQSTLQLQAQFQEILAITAANDMNPQLEARLRPLQTEAHRRLRLLTMEATRLQTAKQPATVEKSRSQINAHLDSLIQFTQGIADEVCA